VKITTWNVNGLRAILNKQAWDWVLSQAPDVLCLQEIKVRPNQLPPEQVAMFDSYQVHWNSAQRPGYSGVASFIHPTAYANPALPQVELGMGVPSMDTEGRLIRSRHPGFLLYNVYFPNGQRDHGRLTYKLDFYRELLAICDALHAAGEQIVICGDFNTAHRPIDLRNPKQNQTTSGFLPEERAWIDLYLEHGFVDAFREMYPERVQYTWWTYIGGARQRNVGWRLDYFLVSASLMPCVQDVIVHDQAMGSDHCPVSLVIKT
jgi:exodeoxyribonuclease III